MLTRLHLSLNPAILALALATAALAGCDGPPTLAPETPATGPATDPASLDYYNHRVQPILQANCYRCHAGLNRKGGLRLDSRDAILHGGKSGAVLTPGHPELSPLIAAIHRDNPTTKPMPPKSILAPADIAALTAWIQAGAPIPRE